MNLKNYSPKSENMNAVLTSILLACLVGMFETSLLDPFEPVFANDRLITNERAPQLA